MSTFAIQYLEPGPHITQLSSLAVREKLRAAFERLPIDMVLIGWRLPDPLVDACSTSLARCSSRSDWPPKCAAVLSLADTDSNAWSSTRWVS